MMRLRNPALLAIFAFAISAGQVAEGQGKGKGQGGGQAEGKVKGQGSGNRDKGPAGGKGQGQSQGKAQAQGKGKGQGNQQSQGQVRRPAENRDRGRAEVSASGGQGRGNSGSASSANRGRSKFVRVVSPRDLPQSVRGYAASRRAQDVIAAGAVAYGFARGNDNTFRIDRSGDGIRIVNLRGDPLVYLDEARARDLGRWRVGIVDDEPREGSPSFCRSGEGHPVWGRQWCLDKGFGLGDYQDFGWGRRTDPGDITFSQGSLRDRLIGSALESVLGTTTFNRLALHAVTLGFAEPLVGTWYTEPAGPQLLRVNSGVYPVAELVDTNRDFRVDDLLIALRSWL